MKSTEVTNTFISARTRGGFVCPCDDLIHIVEVAELSFRGEINKINDNDTLIRSIPTVLVYMFQNNCNIIFVKTLKQI
jgi:hypothetical protein